MARKSEAMYDEPEMNEVASYNGFEIDSDVQLGARTRVAPRAQKYPFDMLQVGQSFHVPATAEMPKPATTLAGAVTNANTKWSHESGQYEEKEFSVFQMDANGKRVRGEDGGFVKIGTEMRTVPVMVADRKFTIRSVDASDPRGPGARVFREL